MPAAKSARQRVIDYGEVFTPPGLVNDMLDLVAHECERVESRFLEPACGDGNFLAEVLRRNFRTVDKRHSRDRQKWERDAILAVSSLYGIDLLADNVAACRNRLLDIIRAAHAEKFSEPLPEAAVRSVAYILAKNVLQGDALSLRTVDDAPIVFPEWSPVNGAQLKRRDFSYDNLLYHSEVSSRPLFSDLGEDIYLPTPVADFPPCHYLQLAQQEPAQQELTVAAEPAR